MTTSTGVAGCLGWFGAESRNDNNETDTPGPDDGNSQPGEDSDSTSGSATDRTSPSDTDNTSVVGPVDSPPTNDEYEEEVDYDLEDPEGALALTDVTLTVTAGRYNPQHLREDEITIEVNGDSFTVTGRVTTKYKCDTFEFGRVMIAGTRAVIRVEVTTTEDDSCRKPENSPWSHPFTLSGRFEGGRPNEMTVIFWGEDTELQADKEL